MTLELDAATTAAVQHLADALGVSAEEAVRRAVESAEAKTREVEAQKKIEALDALCRSLNLDDEKVAAWKAAIRDARR